jgi:hypothetical protein
MMMSKSFLSCADLSVDSFALAIGVPLWVAEPECLIYREECWTRVGWKVLFSVVERVAFIFVNQGVMSTALSPWTASAANKAHRSNCMQKILSFWVTVIMLVGFAEGIVMLKKGLGGRLFGGGSRPSIRPIGQHNELLVVSEAIRMCKSRLYMKRQTNRNEALTGPKTVTSSTRGHSNKNPLPVIQVFLFLF